MTASFAPVLPALDPAFDSRVPVFASAEAVVAAIADDRPVHILYPQAIRRAARAFLSGFAGTPLYAVKCNPTPAVIAELYRAGIDGFDVASIEEIELVRRHAPGAALYFMHPVKSRNAIRHAYLAGVRAFSLDCTAELDKIVEETGADDLDLYVRLGLPKGEAALDLSGKFGVAGAEAVDLLRAARKAGRRLGVCFHVGSQCMDPAAYERAVALVRDLADEAGVAIDVLDVGGGFPARYPGMEPPPLADFFDAIHAAVAAHGFAQADLVCEPGRALVAEGGSVLVKVELRKGDTLYLNDGTFGALYDAGAIGWRYPVRLVRPNRCPMPAAREAAFSFFGPTCDSMDAMQGPFLLPADIDEGDWIEVANLGAYGIAMRTRFNGYHSDLTVAVEPREAQGAKIMPLMRSPTAALANAR